MSAAAMIATSVLVALLATSCLAVDMLMSHDFYNIRHSEVFVYRLHPEMFNWRELERKNNVTYHPSLKDSPDLPDWISYVYSTRHREGFIYGVPPAEENNVQLEIVGLNRRKYTTQTLLLHVNIEDRVDPPEFEVQLKIDNLNVEDIFDTHRRNNLLKIFHEELWPKSSRDLNWTYLKSAIHLGARVPLHPNERDGIVLRLGSRAGFSQELRELEQEVSPLWDRVPCPRDFKRTSAERHFRSKGFAVDWCSFRLLTKNQDGNPPPHQMGASKLPEISLTTNSRSEDVYILPSREEFPPRSYIADFFLIIIVPFLIMIALVLGLSCVMCCQREGTQKPTVNSHIQMVQYNKVRQASDTLRSLSNHREVTPHPPPAPSPIPYSGGHPVATHLTGSPGGSLSGANTLEHDQSLERATLTTRPQPPPYAPQRNGTMTRRNHV